MAKKKNATLASTLEELNDQYGGELINKYGDMDKISIPRWPTGSMVVDEITGGGFPKGRLVELFGQPSSGKTTLALHTIANCQKNGGVCAFFDVEHALDMEWAELLGVNTKELVLSQPTYAEQTLTAIFALIGMVDIIVLDSVAACLTKAELEGEIGDAHVAQLARLMSRTIPKMTPRAKKTSTTLLFLNQERSTIGGGPFGPQSTTTGGNAIPFYSSMRLFVKASSAIKEGDEQVGNKVFAMVKKNKVSPPFKKDYFEIFYDRGICDVPALVEKALELKIIRKEANSYYTPNGEKTVGRGKLQSYLLENEAEMFTIKELISNE